MALREKAIHAVAEVTFLWNIWSIDGFVLCSLFLQMFLFLSAPLRKKSKFVVLVVSIWSAYQLVNTVIIRALALILSPLSLLQDGYEDFVVLTNFWMAFMILHFGGTDTITALSLEDNELWKRTFVDIIFLALVAVNALVSVTNITGIILPFVSTSCVLILFAGLGKSFGRVYSLFRASFDTFELSLIQSTPNLGGDYAAIVEELELHEKAGVPVKPYYPAASTTQGYTNEVSGPINKLSDAQVVTKAYHLFSKFRGTFVDMVYCCHDRQESRALFLSLLPEDGFKIAETEMKFAYEAFYTKMPALSRTTKFLWIPLSLELIALILWSFEDKYYQNEVDVWVTWCLLFGAIFIDGTSILRLYCSDWMMARPGNTLLQQFPLIANLILFFRRRRWGQSKGSRRNDSTSWTQSISFFARSFSFFIQSILFFISFCKFLSRWTLHAMFGNWSESISQLNFINYCIDERSKCLTNLYGFCGGKIMMDGSRYVTSSALTDDLRKFIFDGLKRRSLLAQELDCWEEASSSRGGWFLLCNPLKHLDPSAFEPWILDVEYDESLLIWHIATELCLQAEKEPEDDDIERGHRRFSKILSDYMLYLLLRQPKMMTKMAPLAEVIFRDTTEEARQFFNDKIPSSCLPYALKCKTTTDRILKEACARIMKVISDLAAAAAAADHEEYPRPCSIKEEENHSVLFDACELANRLMRDVRSSRWEFISQMWVELLCYAAGQSPGNAHAALLPVGGELLTLVNLLMLHFGLSNQFRKAKFCRSG